MSQLETALVGYIIGFFNRSFISYYINGWYPSEVPRVR